MPATDYQGPPQPTHASTFSSFGRSLLSLRHRADAAAPTPPPHLDAFQRRMASVLSDLVPADPDDFLSAAWVTRLLDAFLACQAEFAAARGGATAEFGDRAVKALDVCNAAREGLDAVRRWEKLASVAAAAVLRGSTLGEGQLRRARKALADLAVLLTENDTAAAEAAFLAAHRNRSFGRKSSSPSSSSSTHFRSRSWSVSRTWSSARQLQAISAGLSSSSSRAHDPVYAMGCLLHLTAWALIAAVPCPDRHAAVHLHQHHLPPRGAVPWASSLLALQDRIAEEGRRKDRRGAPGLLKEIHALERAARRLAEAIDAAPVVREAAEVKEAAAELAAACAGVRDGLTTMERRVREVFHRIVRSRMEGLDVDSPATNGGGG